MKSPVVGPGFVNNQHTDYTGVCRTFCRDTNMVLGSTLADRGGLCPGVRSAPPWKEVGAGLSIFERMVCRRQTGMAGTAVMYTVYVSPFEFIF